MADADDMVDVAERELQQLVREDAARVCKSEEAVVGEYRAQAHGSCMLNSFIA